MVFLMRPSLCPSCIDSISLKSEPSPADSEGKKTSHNHDGNFNWDLYKPFILLKWKPFGLKITDVVMEELVSVCQQDPDLNIEESNSMPWGFLAC